MNVNDAEFWAGTGLLLISAGLLISPLVFAFDYAEALTIVGIAGLAIGSILVGFSRRGRAA